MEDLLGIARNANDVVILGMLSQRDAERYQIEDLTGMSGQVNFFSLFARSFFWFWSGFVSSVRVESCKTDQAC